MESVKNNTYYEFSDGWFTYFINTQTGEKKLHLIKGDKVVPCKRDDFYSKEFII